MNRIRRTGLILIAISLCMGFPGNAQNKITSYKYWFDEDHNSSTITMVSPVEHLELNSLISLENLSNGLHFFTISFKDERGLWSIPTSQYIYYSDLNDNKITSYQYWFDNDYNTNKIVPVTSADQLNLVTMLSLENIKEGLHLFSIRYKDTKGAWSVPVIHYFYKSNNIAQENNITAYRYWVNDDIQNARYIPMDVPAHLLNLNEDLDFSNVLSGEYVIHFQFKDASNKWSLVTSDTFTHISTVGIENQSEKTINVFPNPTTGIIQILSENEFPLEGTLEVLDYFGRIVLVKHLGNENRQEIDLSELSKGIYYIRIKNKDSSNNYQKIVLQ